MRRKDKTEEALVAAHRTAVEALKRQVPASLEEAQMITLANIAWQNLADYRASKNGNGRKP